MSAETIPFEIQRENMVREQIEKRGIKDAQVLKAMRHIPRHEFVTDEAKNWAYSDSPLSIGEGQTISQPFIVAAMTELLQLKGHECVLEIGTGSGYQTAILCELASHVYSVERIPKLAKIAEKKLAEMGHANIQLMIGDGTLGWPDHAPYDAIIVTAAAPEVPQALLDQLKPGGRLVIPIGARFSQVLRVWQRLEDRFECHDSIGVMFVPLIGKQGWPSPF